MGWLDPPSRRELTLLLFAVTIFFFSYNLDTSIRQFGLDPISKQGAVFNKLGLGSPSIIGEDGRRPPEWRDSLEKLVFGEWHWDEGHTAGDERTKALSGDQFGALWHDRDKIYDLATEEDGVMHDALDWWGANIPTTQLIKHVPGFAILDNVFLYNNSVFIVTDSSQQFSAIGHKDFTVHIISPSKAIETLGRFGGKLRGVSWLCADKHPHNTTLMSLWRTYSSLDTSIDSLGRTILPPPRRLILPRIPMFSDRERKMDDHITKEALLSIPRRRSDTGYHPYLPKVAFPSMGILYQSDLDDYEKMGVPFVLPRTVFATTESSEKPAHRQTFAFPAELEVSPYWWEPIRRSVEGFFENMSASRRKAGKAGQMGITYVHRQWDHTGIRIKAEDHNTLVKALSKLQRDLGHEVSVVSTLEEETTWFERMKAISHSKIILGVHGDHLLDAAYLRPSDRTTVIEFFPPGTFTHDRQLVVRSLGLNYTAWWHNREVSSGDLPDDRPPISKEVSIDTKAVVEYIRDILNRR